MGALAFSGTNGSTVRKIISTLDQHPSFIEYLSTTRIIQMFYSVFCKFPEVHYKKSTNDLKHIRRAEHGNMNISPPKF